MFNTAFDWWLNLWHIGLGGPMVALVIAALVLLAVSNVVIWTLAGLKAVGHAFMVGFRRDRNPTDAQSDEAGRRDQLARLAVDMRAVAESPKD